jgi:phenylacetate-CoA ligase
MRISPIIGRKNQMIKFKGTTLYPASIFDVLDNVDYVENYIVEVSSNDIGTDEVTVIVGSTAHDEEELTKDLKDRFRARLRVAPDIVFDDIEKIKKIQLPESKRKPVKFIDKR